MKTFAHVILNTSTMCLFNQLVHAESHEHAEKLFWAEHDEKYFRLLAVLEVPEETHPEFRLSDLRQFEKEEEGRA